MQVLSAVLAILFYVMATALAEEEKEGENNK